MTTRLCELAQKYSSDKVASLHHDYTPFYHGLLQGRIVSRVLEIGIGTVDTMKHVPDYTPGASLRMWQEYFPSAIIWGVDVDQTAMVNEGKIFSMYCDQSQKESLVNMAEMIGGKFDLIIDDGSHQFDHQLLTANTLIPLLLSPTGVYIIEDVIWRRELYAKLNFPVEVYIGNLKHTPDDCLFIIEGSKL